MNYPVSSIVPSGWKDTSTDQFAANSLHGFHGGYWSALLRAERLLPRCRLTARAKRRAKNAYRRADRAFFAP
jgi:D-serine deaminase-like pyridoxal phosphate-dependent protein